MATPTQPAGAPGPTTDQELERVRRAFGSAFRRMCAASTVADLENELSNMLHQLHRLGELSRWRLGPTGTRLSPQAFGAVLAGSDDLRAARAAMWARRFDTHDLVVVASPLAFPAITTPRCTAYLPGSRSDLCRSRPTRTADTGTTRTCWRGGRCST